MGFIGGALRAFKGDPKFKTKRNVKNAEIEKQITGGLADYSDIASKSAGDLDEFLARYEGYTPTALVNAEQESGVVDKFYNGQIAGDLAGLRQKRMAARQKSVDLALANARQQANASRIMAGGGDSSYSRKLGLDLFDRVNAQALLEDADQERNDYANLLQNQLGMTGRRAGIMDTANQRFLQPSNFRRANLGSNLQLLGGLDALDKSNTFYGLQQKRTGLDRWADFGDAADQGIMSAASLVGSVMGMGGGMGGMGGGGRSMGGGGGMSFPGGGGGGMNFNSGLAGYGNLGGYSFGGLGGYGQQQPAFNIGMSYY